MHSLCMEKEVFPAGSALFFMTGVETAAWAGCMRAEISERPSPDPFCSLEFAVCFQDIC